MDTKEQLCKPFKEDEHEWRIQSMGWKDDKPWAMVLCYVQARPIQERLDEVFGVFGWHTEYREFDGGLICRLSIQHQNPKDDDMLITHKEDGAPVTEVEPFKGGLSKAFVRVAASGYGIGRYLYKLDVTWANCSPVAENGWNKAYDKKNKKNYWWQTPKLPNWAFESESKKTGKKDETKTEDKTEKKELINTICEQIMELADDDPKKALPILLKFTTFKGNDDKIVNGTDNTADLYNYSEKRLQVLHGKLKKELNEKLKDVM